MTTTFVKKNPSTQLIPPKFSDLFFLVAHMTTTTGVLDYTSPLGTDENVNERLFS